MNKTLNLSKVMLGLASLTLSASLWAGSPVTWVTEPVNGVIVGTGQLLTGTTHVVTGPLVPMKRPHMYMDTIERDKYLVTQKHHKVMYLDGIKKGHMVSDWGWKHDRTYLVGDTITNLDTHRSGVITGVKHRGTMDVMTDTGQVVRYQYVTFKVKPL